MAIVTTALDARAPQADPNQCAKDALAGRLETVMNGGPEAIAKRLDHLDSEWSIGRVVKATAGLVAVAGVALGFLVHPWWFALAAVPGLFMVQHMFTQRSVLGELLHSFGMRYGSEIESERVALRALRGDFQKLPTMVHVEDRDALSRMEGEGGIAVEPEAQKVDMHQAAREIAEAAHR